MKRVLVATIVLGLMVSGAAAQSNEVNSVNAVGFLKLSLVSGFTQLAFNWGEVGGDQEIPVQNLFDTSNLNGTMNKSSADSIWMWDAAGSQYVQLWLYNSQGTYPSWDGKWIEASSGLVATNKMPLGQGAWYGRQNETNMNWAEAKPYTL